MVGQKFHKVLSASRAIQYRHQSCYESVKVHATKKSTILTVASLNICTSKNLYTRASLLPPYVLSPQYRVILVTKQIIPDMCIINNG